MVKFGIFKADEFCAKSDPLYETFKHCELPDDAWYEIKAECERHDVIFFATPQNESDLEILLKVGVPCIKVGSDDLTNILLIHNYAKHGLPIILSTGMAELREVAVAVNTAIGVPLLVCACTSEYPCPPEHAHVSRIATLRHELPWIPIGFSDHTIGAQAAIVATVYGAAYFEKHFTLNNFLHGPDHAFSANPATLAEWSDAIRTTRAIMGDGRIQPTDAERENRINWRRMSGQQIRGTA